jgi:photosystem II stability/assembly factor-like uncharacterized protein
MKLRPISLAMLAVLSFASCRDKLTGPAANPSTTDTIAIWNLNGNTQDATGNGHTGSLSGFAIYVPDRFGNSNSALSFESNTVVYVANKSDIDFTGKDSYTITAWVKTTDTATAGILCKGPSDGSYPGYELSLRGGIPDVKMTDGSGGLDLLTDWEAENPKVISAADGNWHLLTMTVTSQGSVELFLDTILQGSVLDVALQPDLNNNGQLLLGATEPGNPNSYTGLLDDVMILNRALLPSEVATRFHEGGWYEHHDTTGHDTTGTGVSFTAGATIGSEVLDLTWINGGNTGFACGKQGAIWKTDDAGKSWNQVALTATVKDLYAIRFDQVDKNWGIAVGDDAQGAGIVYTTDTGATWNSAPLPPGIATLRGVAYAFLNRTAVGSDSDGNGVILFSSDPFGGTVWKIERHTPKPLYGLAFSGDEYVDPTDPLIAVGDGGGIFITTTTAVNGDSTRWIDKSSSSENLRKASYGFNIPPYEAVTVSDQGSTMWSTDNNATNIGNTWIPRNGGATSGPIYAVSNTEAWLADDKILHTTDAGLTWKDISPVAATWVCISQAPGHLAFVTQSGQIYWLQ